MINKKIHKLHKEVVIFKGYFSSSFSSLNTHTPNTEKNRFLNPTSNNTEMKMKQSMLLEKY